MYTNLSFTHGPVCIWVILTEPLKHHGSEDLNYKTQFDNTIVYNSIVKNKEIVERSVQDWYTP